MTWLRPLAFAALMLVAPAADAQQVSPITPEIGASVAREFAGPAFAALVETAGETRQRVDALCAEPSTAALGAARQAFADLLPAWGRVSVLRFGPLSAQNRFERLYFWPDPRGVILHQVQAALAAQDASVTDPTSLGGLSVAVQGLPALEFLLFGTGADELAVSAVFRCAFASAVAANILAGAQEASAGWGPSTPFHASFTAPAVDRDPYRTSTEVAGEVVKALSTTLQFVRTAEILPALGDAADRARGRRAPFWRSDLTFELLIAQVDGMIGLVEAAGFVDSADPLTHDIANSIRFELRNARAALADVEKTAEAAFAGEPDRGRIAFAALALEGANHALAEQFSAAIGLTMGFNALDGD